MILTNSKLKSAGIATLKNEKITSGKANELLVIVPTNRRVRNLKKEFIDISPNNSSGKLNIETLTTFSIKIIESCRKIVKQASKAVSSVLLRQCFSELELLYFQNYRYGIPEGSLQRLLNVISEYKRSGFTSEKILKSINELDELEKLKATELAAIINLYNEKLKKINLYELGDIYYEALSLSSDEYYRAFRDLYPEVNITIVEGFTDLTEPETKLLQQIGNILNNEVFIEFDYSDDNGGLFNHLEPVYSALWAKKFYPIIDEEKDKVSEYTKHLMKNLFNSKQGINNHKFNYTLIEGKNKDEEINFIAKEIKLLINEGKIEPHKIGVVFHLIEEYSPIIRDIFTNHGIPFNLSDRFIAKNFLPVIAIISYLAILENNFYFKDVLRALSSGYFSSGYASFKDIIYTCSDLKLISGYTNWENALTFAINNEEENNDYLKLRYQRVFNEIKAISDNLKPFRQKLLPKEFLNLFNELIKKNNLHTKILNESKDNSEINLRAFLSFINAVEEVVSLIEIEYGEGKKYPLNYFLNLIKTAAENARFNVKEKSNYGVQITTLEEIRGLKFDYLFIGGMVDGYLPTPFNPEIFSAKSFAKNHSQHQNEERYLFFQALKTTDKNLYISFPQCDDKKEFTQSFFINELSKIFTPIKKERSFYLSLITAQDELLINVGKNNIEEKLITEIDIENLKRKIQSDKKRIERILNESTFSGYLDANENKELMSDIFSGKSFSISQLELYAKCPFKYFAERILNLEPIPEPAEEFESRELGILFHNILYKFSVQLKELELKLVGCDNSTFEKASNLIKKIAEEECAKYNFDNYFSFLEREKIFGTEDDFSTSILYNFLIEEQKNDSGLIPQLFEAEFDYEEQINDENKIKLKGKIDRIDVNDKLKIFSVVDYKLRGQKPDDKLLDKGISLQLPIYLSAAKSIFNDEDFQPVDAVIYSLKLGEKNFGPKNLISNKNNKIHAYISNDELQIFFSLITALMKNAMEKINEFINNMKEGKFYLSPWEDRDNLVCKYCNVKQICRIKEVNTNIDSIKL